MTAESEPLEIVALGGRAGPTRLPRPPFILLAPAVLIALAALSPVAYLLLRVSEAGGDAFDLILNRRTAETLLRTVLLAGCVSAATIALALPLAWLTVRTDLPLRRFWAVVTALPLVIPSYVGAFAFVEGLGPRSLLQQILAPLGVGALPEIYGFGGAAFTLTLLTYPYVLLSLHTALWGLDPAVEESSRVLGSGAWQTFFRVTLAQLRPAMAAGGLLVALYTLADFGAVSILRFNSFTNVIYLQYQSAFDRTLAAASSLVLVALALSLLILEAAARGRSRYYKSTTGTSRRSGLVKLGRWRWPAAAFCGIVAGLALVLPLSVLAYLVGRGLAADETFSPAWQAARNSMYVSALAAGVTVLAALPVSLLTVRYAGRWVGGLEQITFLGFSLPGIVVALALVFFGIRYAPALYQTLTLLVFAYFVLYLPVALGPVRTALLQVNPHLEEAARSLGRRPFAAFVSVTLPLLRPGVVAAAALVFLVTMKELPATLILGPIGFQTLATSTWSAAAAAQDARAAFAALVLVLVSALPMAAMMYWERRDEW